MTVTTRTGGTGRRIASDTHCSLAPSSAAIVRCLSPSARSRRFISPAGKTGRSAFNLANGGGAVLQPPTVRGFQSS
jgi:hypothetical protein